MGTLPEHLHRFTLNKVTSLKDLSSEAHALTHPKSSNVNEGPLGASSSHQQAWHSFMLTQ